MANSKTEKTKKPTGLTIKRSGNRFTLSWKIGDKDYGDGQWFSYQIDDTGKDKWSTAQSITKTLTNKYIDINPNNFYPNTKKYLHRVRMRVKGNRSTYTTGSGSKQKTHKPGTSDWASKDFALEKPAKPTLTVTLDSELTNVCVFAWEAPSANDDAAILTDVQWQTILVKNNGETKGKNLDWSAATGDAYAVTTSKTITEDTSILYRNGDSYVRWFRVRSRGPKGASAWVYGYHVYALSNQANVSGIQVDEPEDGTTQVAVDWEVGSDRQNPIDRTTAQYVLTVPISNLGCPSGLSWSDANISADTSNSDAAVFAIDDQLAKDQCLFIRVNTQHDSNITYGQPQLAKIGFLKDPSNLSVQTNNTTHRATITATNNSDVEDSVLVVRYVPASGDAIDAGIIAHGSNSVTVQCPDWSSQTAFAFEVYAMVGTYTKQTRSDNVDSYTINVKMRSENTVSQGGTVPKAPENVSVQKVDGIDGTVQVKWDWPWTEADSAELSWADHSDAWESTDEPETYVVSNLHASKWNISGLEMGKTWYIRVRLLISSTGEQGNPTYGPWSDIEQGTINLASSPNKPVLNLSNRVIPRGGSTIASWVYVTNDKTPQSYAEIAVVSNGNYTPIAHELTAQHVTIKTQSNWQNGQVYNLACRVQSASGQFSDWSDPVGLTIAQPLVCTISQTSLQSGVLTDLPLTLTVTGAGAGGTTSVAIERADSYHIDGPAEESIGGYKGETVALYNQIGQSAMSFDVDDSWVIGAFDDGASYKIVATIQDGLGQSAKAELPFEVHWSHQAVAPSATIIIDETDLIAKITPVAPQGALATDVADIYRLSIDKPELIVSGAEFGETYVDPYPALGDMGGHRIVTRTKNGDYTTSSGGMAWVDSPELGINPIDNDEQLNIIDFEGRQIKFYYDTDYSSTWAKDFEETQYLGGSIQGDWNAAVSRTGTLSTKAITVLDQEMLQVVRRLAEHPGICHVRTADGSSYAADVQVSEDRVHDDQEMLVNYSLSITRVDSQELDGMTLEQYQAEANGV